MGVHESIIPAAVAPMVSPDRRASAYGLFTGVYGIAWFAGSAAIGALFSLSLTSVALFASLPNSPPSHCCSSSAASPPARRRRLEVGVVTDADDTRPAESCCEQTKCRRCGFVSDYISGRPAAVLVAVGVVHVLPYSRRADTDVLDAHLDFYARNAHTCTPCAQGKAKPSGYPCGTTCGRIRRRLRALPKLASTAEVFRRHGVPQFRVRGRHRQERAAQLSSS